MLNEIQNLLIDAGIIPNDGTKSALEGVEALLILLARAQADAEQAIDRAHALETRIAVMEAKADADADAATIARLEAYEKADSRRWNVEMCVWGPWDADREEGGQ